MHALVPTSPEATEFDTPPLTARQKQLIRESFAQLESAGELVGQLVYLRLFQLERSLRILFDGPLAMHGRRLMGALKILTVSLDRLDGIGPALRLLGVRHRQLGVRGRHYVAFARALIWTLEQSLEAKFTREAKEAWTALIAQTTLTIAARNRSGAAVYPVFDEVLDNRGIGQGRDVAKIPKIVLGDFAQDAAHDLARAGLR